MSRPTYGASNISKLSFKHADITSRLLCLRHGFGTAHGMTTRKRPCTLASLIHQSARDSMSLMERSAPSALQLRCKVAIVRTFLSGSFLSKERASDTTSLVVYQHDDSVSNVEITNHLLTALGKKGGNSDVQRLRISNTRRLSPRPKDTTAPTHLHPPRKTLPPDEFWLLIAPFEITGKP